MSIILPSKSKAFKAVNQLATDISQGKFKSNAYLPPDTVLANHYNVSRITMRKVLSILMEHGKVVKVPNKGVMVPSKEHELQNQSTSHSGNETDSPSKTVIMAVWVGEPDANILGINHGIQKYAKEAGLDFHTLISRDNHTHALESLYNIDASYINGLVMMPQPEYRDVLRSLAEKKIPVVGAGRLVGNDWSGYVDSDNALGVYQATHYLIETYHRPAYIIAGKLDIQTSIDRYLGFRRAMEDAGYGSMVESNTVLNDISVADVDYWPMDRKNYAGLTAGRILLDKVQAPLSVVCNNDYVAMGLYEACKERNLVVGKDVMIVGFDDMPFAKRLNPPLTTIRTNTVLEGYTAARLLHRVIKGECKAHESICLPVDLIIRESA